MLQAVILLFRTEGGASVFFPMYRCKCLGMQCVAASVHSLLIGAYNQWLPPISYTSSEIDKWRENFFYT